VTNVDIYSSWVDPATSVVGVGIAESDKILIKNISAGIQRFFLKEEGGVHH
jgi:hypothetical protein